tara:strand:- start:94 stop:702 length:609 start_codon:yes stop_codon:yes gene_type:complete
MQRWVTVTLVGVVLLASVTFPQAQEMPSSDDGLYADSIAIFGGHYTKGDFGQSFNPVAVPYEDNVVLGIGVRQDGPVRDDGIAVGWETGGAVRAGETTSAEVWSGPYVGHDGIELGEAVKVSPSVTFGLSAVTGSMGSEQRRARSEGGSPELLFYLSPEIALSSVQNPDTEVFWRLHHRSGAWGTIGAGSANATTVGLRQHF